MLSIVIGATILSLTLYWVLDNEVKNQLQKQAETVHSQVQQRFRIFDELLTADENDIHVHAEAALLSLAEILLTTDKQPNEWSDEALQKMAEEKGVDGIYIVDKDTNVIATNFLPDLHFNLGSISSSFNQYLRDFIGSGRIEVDRINVSSKTGVINIYAYYSPKGSDYLVEVSYDVKKHLSRNRSSRYVDFMFDDFFTEMANTSLLLENVDIYLVNNHAAFPFLSRTEAITLDALPPIPDTGVITIQEDGNKVHYYSQADLIRTQLHSADYIVVRSTFDSSSVYTVVNKFLMIGALVGFVVIGFTFWLLTLLFDKWVIRRIFGIIAALERSADGNYRPTKITGNQDELSLILQHINNMNQRIEARDLELKDAKDLLEERVTQRTQALEAEIDARKKAEAKLITLAETDPLTGALNRRAFSDRASTEITRAQRFERPIAVILLDLDHFKHINDRYGHPFGDKALVALAELIQPCLRSIDSLSRHGGEEFLILLPETSEQEAWLLAERLRKALETLEIMSESIRCKITASFGVASWQTHEVDIQAAIHRADQALYSAKRKGRNRVIAHSKIER